MREIRAAFISDLHVTGQTTAQQIQALVDGIIALSPDILLMGGDYADLRCDAERLYECLRGVHAPLGKYAVLGNNDTEDWPDYESHRTALKKAGIELLVNESRAIPLKNGTLLIAGVDEHLEGAPDSDGLYPERSGEDLYRILLSHYPCVPKQIPDLMLSGHTHGGQFNAFGFTPFTIGFERMMTRKASSVAIAGLHDMNGAKLFVGKGVGASRLQLRIGVRPEIYELRFEC